MFLIHKFNCQCYHNIETIINIPYRALFTIFPYIEYKVYPLCWVAVEPLQTPFCLGIAKKNKSTSRGGGGGVGTICANFDIAIWFVRGHEISSKILNFLSIVSAKSLILKPLELENQL